MEDFFSRYKNPLVLMIVLFIQVVGLATQVKRTDSAKPPGSGGGPRLIRVWTVTLITPFEKAFSGTGHFVRRTWRNYIDLHDARKENQELQAQLVRLKMEQARLQEDAQQAKRLQALLDFKERYVGQTMPAQVIGTSGADQSRLIYIDKGSRAGIKQDMPVITPDGIVGKIKEVFPFTSQVLLVNDHDSGAGVLMQNSRYQGILKGTPQGQLVVTRVMSDNNIETGEHVVTTGGDGIYPKGVPVGTVVSSAPDADNDPFLKITLKPAANLDKLEEVLVITRVAETTPSVAAGSGSQRAADILAQRLPSAKPEATPTPTPTPASRPAVVVPPAGEKKPAIAGASPSAERKPAVAGATPGQPGLTQKKSTGVIPGASPAPAPPSGQNTATSGTTSGTKKPATGQKKAQGTDVTPAGTAPATPTPPATAPSTKKSAAGTPTTGGTDATTKKKAPAKPKADATPAGTAPRAIPVVTPKQKKPEVESQPTPPPAGENPRP